MSYLFGDSTPSKLEGNYIEFLRDAVEFCVQLLLSDQRVVQGKAQTRTLEHATVAEVERLQKLAPLVTKAFEGTALGAADSPTARTAGAISKAAIELVRAESIRMRDALDLEIGKRDATAAEERESALKALETLIVKHELPGSVSDLHVMLAAGGRYGARARTKTAFGLETLLDLEIPANHLFEKVVRVDRLAEKLDVQAPEVGGWVRKEVKRRPQHLEKHHVVEVAISADGGTLKLRLAPDGTGAGFDILFASEAPRVRMLRVAEQQDAAAEQPFEVDDEDAKKLLALYGKLTTATAELAGHRRRVLDAKLDNEAMRTHSKPTLLAERLIATMAPVVQEIAWRSQSPNELVLRRLLSGDRREEIFLSKAELKEKLEPLNEVNRALFDPLWLTAPPAAPAAKADAAPHTQPIRHRPGTPSLGTPSLSMSSLHPAPTASKPTAETSATPPPPPPSGDILRKTLIGAAVQDIPPADPVSKTLPDPPPADPVSKTPLAAVPHIEALRKEAAGTIESAVVKQVNPTTRS
jgi:hypothetical protein